MEAKAEALREELQVERGEESGGDSVEASGEEELWVE